MVISNQTGTNINVVDGGRSGAVGRAGNSAATAAQAATTSTRGKSFVSNMRFRQMHRLRR